MKHCFISEDRCGQQVTSTTGRRWKQQHRTEPGAVKSSRWLMFSWERQSLSQVSHCQRPAMLCFQECNRRPGMKLQQTTVRCVENFNHMLTAQLRIAIGIGCWSLGIPVLRATKTTVDFHYYLLHRSVVVGVILTALYRYTIYTSLTAFRQRHVTLI